RSVVSWLRSTPASRGTPMTTSAKLSPPASRTRTDRTSLTPGTERAASSTRPATPDGGRGVAGGQAGRDEPESDEHGQRAREVRAEVPGVRKERGVSVDPALAQR